MAKCPHTSTAHPFVRRQKPSNYSPEPAVKLSNRTFSLGNLYRVITVSPVSVYQSTISRFFWYKIVWVYKCPSNWQPSLKMFLLVCLKRRMNDKTAVVEFHDGSFYWILLRLESSKKRFWIVVNPQDFDFHSIKTTICTTGTFKKVHWSLRWQEHLIAWISLIFIL